MDIFELQEKCREIRKINEWIREYRRKNPVPVPFTKGPPRRPWDFLKDYPGQWLSDEEFNKRYHAWNQRREEAELRRVAEREELWGQDPFARKRR